MSDKDSRIRDLFGEALELEPSERAAFLDKACGDDRALRDELASLLGSEEQVDNFLEKPLVPAGLGLRRYLPESIRQASSQPETNGHTQTVDSSPQKPSFRSPVALVVLGSSVVLLGLYALAAWRVSRPGYPGSLFGWSAAPIGNAWVVTNVTPNGPAAGKLQIGDRIAAFNGQPPAQNGSEDYFKDLAPTASSYSVGILRGSEARTVQLSVPVTQRSPVRITYATYLLISLAFFAAAIVMGLLKPQDGLGRLGFAAGVLTALRFLAGWLGVFEKTEHQFGLMLTDVVAVFGPLQLPVTYHFFCRFFQGVLYEHVWLLLRRCLYVAATLVSLLYLAVVVGASLADKLPLAVLYRHSWLMQLDYASLQGVSLDAIDLVSCFSICALVACGYRRLPDLDRQRRTEWLVFGSIVAVLPSALSVLGSLLLAAAGGRQVMHSAAWTVLQTAAKSFVILIPVAMTYVVVSSHVLRISVVARHALHNVLQKSVLQTALLLPIIGLVWPILRNPNRPLSESLELDSLYLYGALLALLYFAIRRHRQLSTWVDRRVFPEAYERERTLRHLARNVKELESVGAVSSMVAGKLQAALHTKFVHVLYRSPGAVNLRIAHSLQDESRITSGHTRQTNVLSEVRQLHTIEEVSALEERASSRQQLSGLIPICDGQDKLIGLLALGPRGTEEPYTATDRRLLGSVAAHVADAWERVWQREQTEAEHRTRGEIGQSREDEELNRLRECPECGACFDGSQRHCTLDGTLLTQSLPIQRTIAHRYRLTRRIGSGGMSTVYEALDVELSRRVAIKVMTGNLVGNRSALKRFKREAQATARLNHPNIVALYDYGWIGPDGAYLVMELAGGPTWRSELKRRGMLSAAVAADWFDQLLNGLAAAHDAGIIHRDLKPENVLVIPKESGGNVIKIVDFGIARFRSGDRSQTTELTEPGLVMGTIGYMSPEQIKGLDLDERSDIYSVGVMIAEAITGQLPLGLGTSEQPVDISFIERRFPIPGDSLGTFQLGHILQRCLAYDPAQRFANAAEMRRLLAGALQGLP